MIDLLITLASLAFILNILLFTPMWTITAIAFFIKGRFRMLAWLTSIIGIDSIVIFWGAGVLSHSLPPSEPDNPLPGFEGFEFAVGAYIGGGALATLTAMLCFSMLIGEAWQRCEMGSE